VSGGEQPPSVVPPPRQTCEGPDPSLLASGPSCCRGCYSATVGGASIEVGCAKFITAS